MITKTLSLEEGQYLEMNRQIQHHRALTFIDTAYTEKVYNGWHSHERSHLTFVLDGGNREKRKNTDQQLKTGQVVFYHNHEMHQNDHTVFPSRNLNLEIEPAFFADYAVNEAQISHAVQTGRLTSLEFTRLFQESLFKDPEASESIHLLLLSFITRETDKAAPEWLFRVRDLLNDRWDQWPTLTELAAESQVHPVTLSKYFHRYFGCTLGAYMRKLKAQRALTMIRGGHHSLSEICHACGFADHSHFIRSFKHATGMLPKKFEKF